MNLNDIATRILDARRTTRSSPLGRRAARRLANDTETLLAAVTAILALHRPDEHGICEICRDGPGGPDIGAPCPTTAVALGIARLSSETTSNIARVRSAPPPRSAPEGAFAWGRD